MSQPCQPRHGTPTLCILITMGMHCFSPILSLFFFHTRNQSGSSGFNFHFHGTVPMYPGEVGGHWIGRQPITETKHMQAYIQNSNLVYRKYIQNNEQEFATWYWAFDSSLLVGLAVYFFVFYLYFMVLFTFHFLRFNFTPEVQHFFFQLWLCECAL